jgi:hypothetical protein
MRIFPFVLLLACTGEPKSDDSGEDTDLDGDADTDADADTDTDTDTDDQEYELVSLEVACVDADTTRETVACTATGTYEPAMTQDDTTVATWTSSDESVVKFYVAGTGQPLWSGTVDVTATLDGVSDTVTVNVGAIAVASAGDLVFNEVLADGLVDGDPNGDGSLDNVEDEFVEIGNHADVTVDVSGVTIFETDFPFLARHTFPAGTVLRAGEALVVFGGGDVSAMSATNATFSVADNEDPGLQYGLSLKDDTETVRLVAADGTTDIATMTYGTEEVPAVSDGSNTLDPDVFGTSYAHHFYATGSTTWFSPGTYVDGSAFPGPDGRYAP